MSKIKLDLNQFQHVKSDKKTTTLRHKDGHELTIAHAAMHPEAQEQLKALASLATPKASKSQNESPSIAKDDAHEKEMNEKQASRHEQHKKFMDEHERVMDMGKKPAMMADGGNTPTVDKTPQLDPQKAKDFVKGYDQPQTMQEGLTNIQNEVSSWFNAEGGEVKAPKEKPQGDTLDYKKLKKEYISKIPQNDKESRQKRAKFAMGGVTYPPCLNPNCKSHGKPHPNCRCYGGGTPEQVYFNFAEGGKIELVNHCSSGDPHEPDCEYFKDGGKARAPEIQGAPSPAPEVPDDSQVSLQADDQTPPVSPQAASQDAPSAAPAEASSTPAGLVNQASSQPSQAPTDMPQAQPATPDSGSDQSQAGQKSGGFHFKPTVTPSVAYAANKQAQLDGLKQENDAWQHDLVNGHITPMTYQSLFHDKSTLGKVGTLFGMLLSGAGSGLTGQPNAVMQMMNQTISNDLAAQQNSKTNAQNYLRLNQQDLMNKAQVQSLDAETATKAYALSRAQMNASLLHDLTQQVKTLPVGSEKWQQAQQMLGMLYNSTQDATFNILDRGAAGAAYYKMLGLNGQGGSSTPGAQGDPSEQAFQNKVNAMRMLGPQGEARAKDMESKHYPGIIGQASAPMESSDKEYLQAGTGFQRQMDNFINWTKNHSGSLNPSDIKTGQAMAADLQGAYRQATHGGVYKEGEQNFISKLIDDTPTKFFNNIRVLPSLEAISNDNKNRVDQHVKNLGFQGYQGTSGPQEQSKTKSSAPAGFEDYVNKNINSKDPTIQKRVQGLKSKYGI